MRGDRRWLRLGLIGLYGFIGVVHLAATDRFLPIMPDWVPAPRLVVIGTGLCEIAGALALLVPRLRRLAGLMLALYAVCVFPANIKQAVEGISVPPIPDTWWYHGPRLALQPVMVWWALYAVRAIDWPLAARSTDTHGAPR
ncbi:DoxX family protein [Methylobacterium sp. DB1607]|nr:DoxX family protein [Methylobacterium sp. DB1607]